VPIFEFGQTSITPISATSFSEVGLKERGDLQRLLRDQIAVIAEDVLVIAEEFGEWTDSRRRIDLLGIDKNANIVVIELKRTEDGGHMELQSLRYASMVSTLTAARAVEIFGAYLESRGLENDPEQTLLEFLGWDEINEDDFGQDVRMVLVSSDFSMELTTTVLWLNEKELDIRCVRIRPYKYGEKVLVDVQQVIPLPESADYQVQVREKKRRERASRNSGMDFTRYDIQIDGEVHENQWKRNSILLVVKAIVDSGVSPEEINALFKSNGRGNAFLAVDGVTMSSEEFAQLAEATLKAHGKTFHKRRWHLRDEDLMCEGNRTYSLTNQWGKHWPSFMQALKEKYPQIGLDYWPTGSKPD
jgi:hypothetical protein